MAVSRALRPRRRDAGRTIESACCAAAAAPTIKATLLVLLAIAAYYWSVQGTQASPAELIDGLPNIWHFIERLFPPEFDTQTQDAADAAVHLVGLTLPRLGLSVSTFPTRQSSTPSSRRSRWRSSGRRCRSSWLRRLPCWPRATSRTRWSTPTTRLLLNANRAIPEIIFALIFVAAVGLGPFGGVLALAIGSIGFMSKVYAEAIEAIDPQQVLAMRATGADALQTLVYARGASGACRSSASYTMLNFEHNVGRPRSSASSAPAASASSCRSTWPCSSTRTCTAR